MGLAWRGAGRVAVAELRAAQHVAGAELGPTGIARMLASTGGFDGCVGVCVTWTTGGGGCTALTAGPTAATVVRLAPFRISMKILNNLNSSAKSPGSVGMPTL